MKTLHISDLHSPSSNLVSVYCWIKSVRKHGNVIFCELVDSTGSIQAILEKSRVINYKDIIRKIRTESAIAVDGFVIMEADNSTSLQVTSLKIISTDTISISPSPRSDFDIFSEKYIDLMLSKRHLYIRNPKVIAILKFRDRLLHQIRQWFWENGFISVDAPILTPIPLYEGDSAMPIIVQGEKIYLTQCVGYYLEASVHALEKVYNIGPSFRGEESRSKRHLMEYWHIKAEMAWGNFEDIISVVEELFRYITETSQAEFQSLANELGTTLCTDGSKTPFERIPYRKAVDLLRKNGSDIEFGKSLSSSDEELLSKHITGLFWVTGIPRHIEPFPYSIDQNDEEVTMTADLIASNGFGELLGVAEKINDFSMLAARMKEKDKFNDARYNFVKEVHQLGCVPHVAFGMGVERLIRWMLNIPHVRDAVPFPRIFRRKVNP